MYSAILLVALSTVGGHKCHGCAAPVDCSGYDCGGPTCAVVACDGGCSCAKVKRHKCGLFKRLFKKRCHGACDCAGDCGGYDCGAPACCEPAPACCEPAPSCCEPAPAPACPACPPTCASAAITAPAPAVVANAGFRVDRSPLVAVAFDAARPEFKDEPIVIFARN